MINLSRILAAIGTHNFIGNPDILITAMISFDPGNKESSALMWVNDKNLEAASALEFGTLICSKMPDIQNKNSCNYIIVPNPRSVFKNVLENFFKPIEKKGIAQSANIHSSVSIGKNVFVGENVVIEENCILGNNVSIYHNSIILSGTKLKNNVKIGCNCTIGGVGFGYEKDVEGNYELIPHLGNVVIENNVEIGNNTCIDRAVLGSTHLDDNVKVDNLVHIAHGVQIGKNSLIIADAMIGGSTVIGENVWVAPSSSVINKCRVGNNSLIGMGAVVVKSVRENEVVVGNPAKVLKKD